MAKNPLVKEWDKWQKQQQSAYTKQDSYLGVQRQTPSQDPFMKQAQQGNFNSIINATSNTPSVDDLYNAIAYTETGTHPQAKNDPWVRTHAEGSGSSAYGPVQMTGGETFNKKTGQWDQSMMMNVYDNPDLAKKIGITDDEIGYMQRYIEQADQFLQPVSDEPGSTYGYGGSGDLTSPEDKSNYESIAKKFIKYELGRVGGDVDKFIKNWRGDDADTDYFNKFYSQINP